MHEHRCFRSPGGYTRKQGAKGSTEANKLTAPDDRNDVSIVKGPVSNE